MYFHFPTIKNSFLRPQVLSLVRFTSRYIDSIYLAGQFKSRLFTKTFQEILGVSHNSHLIFWLTIWHSWTKFIRCKRRHITVRRLNTKLHKYEYARNIEPPNSRKLYIYFLKYCHD